MAFVTGVGGVQEVRRRSPLVCSAENARSSRREFLLAGISVLGLSVFRGPDVVAAEEKPGLPPGALQFDRILKAQKNWEEIREVVSTKGGEMTNGEWEGIRAFLRKFYRIGDDIDYLAKSLTKENRIKAQNAANDLRQVVKGMDKPALNKDVDQFLVMHKQAKMDVVTFFDLLKANSDIPDEL